MPATCHSKKLKPLPVGLQPGKVEQDVPLDLDAVPRPLKLHEALQPEGDTVSSDVEFKDTPALLESSQKCSPSSTDHDVTFANPGTKRENTAALLGLYRTMAKAAQVVTCLFQFQHPRARTLKPCEADHQNSAETGHIVVHL